MARRSGAPSYFGCGFSVSDLRSKNFFTASKERKGGKDIEKRSNKDQEIASDVDASSYIMVNTRLITSTTEK